MKLKKLYSLRKDFTIIGLTGRVGSGCSEIAKWLSTENFNNDILNSVKKNSLEAEEIKFKICCDYLSHSDNWKPFHVIYYKDVLLLHLFHQGISESDNNIDSSIEKIIEIIFQNGENGQFKRFINRFDFITDVALINQIKEFLHKNDQWYDKLSKLGCDELNACLKEKKEDPDFFSFYFNFFENFSKEFYEILNKHDITKRTRLVHDLANNLREYGFVRNCENLIKKEDKTLDNIYTVAETINKLIKVWKANNEDTKIVIDALKNSLELMYFKEKYSAFYMIATNKSEEERTKYVEDQIRNKYKLLDEEDIKKHTNQILFLDRSEYRGEAVNKGEFSVPDTENCIQKSDYHIYFSNVEKGIIEDTSSTSNYLFLSIDRQLVKLISLIHQPGIITPTGIERCMQVAYNAKFNSGCISRQVGAVVTDENYSVKSIGWNDVAQHQMPCNLRSVNDLLSDNPSSLFSEYEKSGGEFKDENDNINTFKDFLKEDYKEIANVAVNLEGKNCPFCFKTVQNTYEKEKNQVHTRSLHAEENAMMQITKNGGNGLKGGNLFTTASPCELCSKKAYQLGIKKIFFIDPYPGIATKHILKNGISDEKNPKLLMFQGAVGRAFHKLYEPFMAYKDELKILTNISPKERFNIKDIQKLSDKFKNEPELFEKVKNAVNDNKT
jgi:deoxycytidylate deaminase